MRHCLNTSKTLRKQLFSSFGLAAILSLLIVVISACVCVWSAGEIVKVHSSHLLREYYEKEALIQSSQLMAEKLSARMADIEGSVQILVEALQDRIVGYPTMDGWENGLYVPFIDSITQTAKYPLQMQPVPFVWNITLDSVYEEERIKWFGDYGVINVTEQKISTKTAAFHFQRMKDDYNNADDNNTTTSTTRTYEGIYKSTGDLSVFMKPLYETRVDTLRLNIYFANEGSGATLQYPASRIIPPTDTYVSMGCDWMSDINDKTGLPYVVDYDDSSNTTGTTYGTTYTQSKKFCHSKGEIVNSTNYNPMEEAWASFFIQQKDHNNVGWYGPLSEGASIMKAGKAVFDRL